MFHYHFMGLTEKENCPYIFIGDCILVRYLLIDLKTLRGLFTDNTSSVDIGMSVPLSAVDLEIITGVTLTHAARQPYITEKAKLSSAVSIWLICRTASCRTALKQLHPSAVPRIFGTCPKDPFVLKSLWCYFQTQGMIQQEISHLIASRWLFHQFRNKSIQIQNFELCEAAKFNLRKKISEWITRTLRQITSTFVSQRNLWRPL